MTRITSFSVWRPILTRCGRLPFFSLPSALIFLFSLFPAALSSAQQAGQAPATDYSALIQRAAENETHALEQPASYQFQETLEWTWGSETRSVIETAEGRADRIVLFHGKPLAPDQQAKQKRRLEKLLTDRDAVKNEARDWQSETQRRLKMLKAFPKACVFEFAGQENGLLRFTFRPNPDFSPKDRETEMYRGMEGAMWLEPLQERMVRIEGKLVKDVSFGWGIFGRLYKGGTYEIAQTQLSPGVWRITTLNVDVRYRVFLGGSHFLRRESNKSFRPTPSTVTYREAVQDLLLNASGMPAETKTDAHPAQPEPAPNHPPKR